jgi:hypothetical protein
MVFLLGVYKLASVSRQLLVAGGVLATPVVGHVATCNLILASVAVASCLV